MAWAAGIIIGTIARANRTQIGLASETVLLSDATAPRRIVSDSPLKFLRSSGVQRNSSVPPR